LTLLISNSHIKVYLVGVAMWADPTRLGLTRTMRVDLPGPTFSMRAEKSGLS